MRRANSALRLRSGKRPEPIGLDISPRGAQPINSGAERHGFSFTSANACQPCQIPGTAIAALPDSLAPFVTSFGPLTPTPTVPGSQSGGVPTGFSTSVGQTLSNSQIFGPQFGEILSTGASGGYSTSANNTGVTTANNTAVTSANTTGVENVNQYVGVSGTGIIKPLPASDLDLAFTPAIDLAALPAW